MPAKKRVLKPPSIFDEMAVLDFFRERGYKEMHYYTLCRAVINSRPGTLKEVDLPSAHKTHHCQLLPTRLVEQLAKEFVVCTSRVTETHVSSDGTTKLLIELQDGERIESVIIRHQGRNTLCVSSQLGCRMACKFCATGTMGLKGNLTGGEIVEQLYHANAIAPIRNVVYMGMGEPLENYDAVIESYRTISDVRRFALSHNQLTISTVGVIHNIRNLTRDAPSCSLALSLHAANQELRSQIVPSAKAFPIPKLLQACWEHVSRSKKPLFVEYILIKQVNDRPQHAHELGQLLHGRDVVVNLIPYNPTYVDIDYESPDEIDIDTFYHVSPPSAKLSDHYIIFYEVILVLADQYKLRTTVRRHHGRDLEAACGQLALLRPGRPEREGRAGGKDEGGGAVRDIEDLVGERRRSGGGAAVTSGQRSSKGQSGGREVANGRETDKVDTGKSLACSSEEPKALSVKRRWLAKPTFGESLALCAASTVGAACAVGLVLNRNKDR